MVDYFSQTDIVFHSGICYMNILYRKGSLEILKDSHSKRESYIILASTCFTMANKMYDLRPYRTLKIDEIVQYFERRSVSIKIKHTVIKEFELNALALLEWELY